MTDPQQPNQPGPPNQPYQAPYQPPPGFQPPPPERRSGLPTWAIALIVGGVLVIVLCFAVAIVSVGVLTLLGSRVSQVFSSINSEISVAPIPVIPGASTTPIESGSALSLGDSANLPGLRVSVTGARPLTDVGGARPPAPGKQYWAVEVTFENTSSRPATLSAFTSAVRDAAGATYPYSIAGQRASPDPGLRVVETLRPDTTISGTLFYELPEDSGELFWMYEDVSGGGQAVFKIK